MVEAGDTVGATLKKEFAEETLNVVTKSPNEVASHSIAHKEAKQLQEAIDNFFVHGDEVYKYGIVSLFVIIGDMSMTHATRTMLGSKQYASFTSHSLPFL